MLATALLLAGTDTARNQVAAASIEVLCDNPDQWKLLRDKPDLAMSAVCLGANLARLEIAEALKTVTRRIPYPRRAGQAPWKPVLGLSGPISLPIVF
jgi:cytochrome P450